MERRIIVALDNMDEARALSLAQDLAPGVWGFKVNDLLLHCGVSIIEKLAKHGKVFADAKVHEIPNTTRNSVRRLVSAGASIVTVHASGGLEMLQAAQEESGTALICAVTVLTSIDTPSCESIFGEKPAEKVLGFAQLAQRAGVGGIICSPQELEMLSAHSDVHSLKKVCPGVRPSWYQKQDDQSRVATPSQAIADGAYLLVVGRPITSAADPLEAASRIQDELS